MIANDVLYKCPFCHKQKTYGFGSLPYCKHGEAQVTMQPVVELGSFYDEKAKVVVNESDD